jgi:hypothetical protein
MFMTKNILGLQSFSFAHIEMKNGSAAGGIATATAKFIAIKIRILEFIIQEHHMTAKNPCICQILIVLIVRPCTPGVWLYGTWAQGIVRELVGLLYDNISVYRHGDSSG